jgi:hypothetical protein
MIPEETNTKHSNGSSRPDLQSESDKNNQFHRNISSLQPNTKKCNYEHPKLDIPSQSTASTNGQPNQAESTVAHPGAENQTEHTVKEPFQIEIHLDTRALKSKPKDVAPVNNRVAKNRVKVTVDELIQRASQGYAWTPAAFKDGKRTIGNWELQWVLGIDFDSGLEFEAARARLLAEDLDFTFAYHSYSSTVALPKWRGVIVLEEPVTSQKEADFILKKLLPAIFPENDKSARDTARLFYGGTKLIHQNPRAILNRELFLKLITVCVAYAVSDSKVISTRFFEDLQKNVHHYSNSYSATQIFAEHETTSSPNLSGEGVTGDSEFTNLLEKFDFDQACKECLILADFKQGKRLHYHELLGIATNLVRIKGGAAWFQKCIAGTDNDRPSVGSLLKIFRFYDHYHPKPLKDFSPYPEDHKYWNILKIGKNPDKPIRLEEYKPAMTLKESKEQFDKLFREALSDDKKSYVFKLPTGAGKSEALTKLRNVALAFPTHALKAEMSERMSVPHFVSASLPDSIPRPERKRLEYLYRVGAYGHARGVLNNLAKSDPNVKLYLKNFNEMYSTSRTLLTTHALCFWHELKGVDTIIFDEDPLRSMLEINRVKLSDLQTLARHSQLTTKDQQILNDFIQVVLAGMSNSATARPNFAFDRDTKIYDIVANSEIFSSNILDLFCADYYAITSRDKEAYVKGKSKDLDIHYLLNRTDTLKGLMHKKKKRFIVMSATANEFIYRQLFGDDVVFHDLSDVPLKGLLRQHTEFSFSRYSLANESDRKKQVLDEINESGRPVITFAEHKHLFEKAIEEVHHGNVLGYDSYKGQDLIVVGTPHIHPVTYILYCAALGIKTQPTDFLMQNRLVEYGGFRFTLQTFESEDIRILQFYHLEEGLIQAVGRARLLRENARVDLYSNFPLKQACIDEVEEMTVLDKPEVDEMEGDVLSGETFRLDCPDEYPWHSVVVTTIPDTFDREKQEVWVTDFAKRRKRKVNLSQLTRVHVPTNYQPQV